MVGSDLRECLLNSNQKYQTEIQLNIFVNRQHHYRLRIKIKERKGPISLIFNMKKELQIVVISADKNTYSTFFKSKSHVF